jgi:hypothetical protein
MLYRLVTQVAHTHVYSAWRLQGDDDEPDGNL